METVFQGLVIPKIVYVSEIEEAGPNEDLAYRKRFEFFVWVDEKVIKFDRDEKDGIYVLRQVLVDKINSYYRDLAVLSRPRREGGF